MASILDDTELRDLGLNQGMREKYLAAAMVAGAAVYLDIKRPEWDICIDLNDLQSDTTAYDILGQLYGHYELGLKHLGLTGDLPEKLGFVATWIPTTALDAAWKAEIVRRRKIYESRFLT